MSRRPRCRGAAAVVVVVLLASALSGCATIGRGGAPEPSFDIDKDLEQLAKQFGHADAIASFYAAPSVDARNRFISGRLTMMNIRYIQFIRSSTADKQLLDSAAQMLTLGLSLAGATVPGAATKTLLAVAAAGVTGSKEIVDKNYYYEKTIPALIAQMNAERRKALVPLLSGMTHSLSTYTFEQAIDDLHTYYFAGTFIGAINAIQADAGAKERAQDEVIARLTPVSVADVATKRGLTAVIGRLQAGDLSKIQAAIKAIDPDATPATTLAGAKDQLQDQVRGARSPAEITRVARGFTSAGLPTE